MEASRPPVPVALSNVAMSWNAVRIHSAAVWRSGDGLRVQGATPIGREYADLVEGLRAHTVDEALLDVTGL